LKPVHLNQLLFHRPKATLSFFCPAGASGSELENILTEIFTQLHQQKLPELVRLLDKNRNSIEKITRAHPQKSHGFFISTQVQGHIILETSVESYFVIGLNFHVRPLLEELFVNPEYLVVNISLYDINIYRGDFHHLEIVQQFEFDQLASKLTPDERSRVFTPQHVGLVSYKTILALKNMAQTVREMSYYDSVPVMVTGLDEMKQIFLRYFRDSEGVISHIQEDFYEKTCVEILEKCKKFRYPVIDFYSARFKERLKKMVKSRRLISELGAIIQAIQEERVIYLILPNEQKVWGKINLQTAEYEIHKRPSKNNDSVDILNELAEEVMRQGGKIQILAPHFFPQNTFVLAILRG
jgi:hypothetical protein